MDDIEVQNQENLNNLRITISDLNKRKYSIFYNYFLNFFIFILELTETYGQLSTIRFFILTKRNIKLKILGVRMKLLCWN